MTRIAMAAMIIMVLAVPAMAGGVGGPALPAGKLEAGYQLEASEREYQFVKWSSSTSPTEPKENYDLKIRSIGHHVTVAYGFTDRFEGQVFLGGTALTVAENKWPSASADWLRFEDSLRYSWGLGMKYTMPDVVDQIDLTVGTQYFIADWSDVNWSDSTNDNPDVWDVAVESRMWNISLIASRKFGQFTPYSGFRYSDNELEVEHIAKVTTVSSVTSDYETDNNWGGVAGVDVDFTENISGNLEGRYGDEKYGITAGITFRF